MRVVRSLLLLALLALAAPAGAEAAWSTPITISAPGQDATAHQVAINESGDAAFVWTRPDGNQDDCGSYSGCQRVQARVRSAAGGLSAVQTLSDPGEHAYNPQVAIDQGGNALLTWTRSDGSTGCGGYGCFRVQARARSAAGALGATQTVSPGIAYYPQVAVDDSGDAVFVWQRYVGSAVCNGHYGCILIEARTRSAAGVLSAIQTLSAPADWNRDARGPQVGLDPNGNAVFIWSSFDGTHPDYPTCCSLIQARARSAAGVLSAIYTLTPAGRQPSGQDVAVDQTGNAVLVWTRTDGTTDCSGVACSRVETRVRSSAGALSPLQTLSASGQTTQSPDVGVDQNGNAVFVWRLYRECSQGCTRIQARARSATGALSSIQTLSPAGRHSVQPQVAVDPSGNAVFAWTQYDFTTACNGFSCPRIEVRVRSAAGALGAGQFISDPGVESLGPSVGVDQSGKAVAAWRRFGNYLLVQAATGP
jgi:hypothetical protein